jgi:hypothetical protein
MVSGLDLSTVFSRSSRLIGFFLGFFGFSLSPGPFVSKFPFAI